MRQAFIIMQIGSSELDKVCEDAILPALKANSLDAKRVDKHNQGGLLKNEIINFIENSDIIIADLTNERPNCYLEIGYAMGIDKFSNLILTAREDHLPESPNHKADGPKIHFDLAGYDILFWHPEKLGEFRDELDKRIRRRLAVLAPADQTTVATWDDDWINTNREKAFSGLKNLGFKGYMEIRYALVREKVKVKPKELLIAADRAQIHTFGWPIGIVMPNAEFRPRPIADGVVTEISTNSVSKGDAYDSYDFWQLRRNGDFYLLRSLFEDDVYKTKNEFLFFNTRIVQTTEALLHCARLFSNIGVIPSSEVAIAIKHGGLLNRKLSASTSDRRLFPNPISTTDESEQIVQIRLSSIESSLVETVKKFMAPLFELFDFYEFADVIYDDIVNKFVDGNLS
jgi:hypothetical protein